MLNVSNIMDIRVENIEAEQTVLGSILLEGDLIKETRLEPHHFSRKEHQKIFEAMKEVESSGMGAVDLVTVTTALGDAIHDVGGVGYLADLSSSIASTANFRNYERLIIDAYRRRMSRNAALAFAENPTDENLIKLYNQLGELQEIGVEEEETLKDVLSSILHDLYTPSDEISGIDTGLTDLNKLTGGLQNGDLIIVAARPSMGKTAFALNLSMANCMKGGVTNIFSLEMPKKQLVHRMLSAIGGVDLAKWRNPARLMSDDDHERIAKATGILEKFALNIYDQPGQSIHDIRAAVRKSIKKEPNKRHLVVIDYLQLISIVGRFDRHDLAIGYITRELKKLAREFNIPVVLLSQLSRGVEQRQEKRPMLSDLRDSGNIEQDADVVMFLYRDDYYNRDSEHKNITEVIVAKQRNGPVDKVETVFIKEYGQFKNLEMYREDEGMS